MEYDNSTALVSITCNTQENFRECQSWIEWLNFMAMFDPDSPEIEILDEVNDPEFETFAYLVYMPMHFAQAHIEDPENGKDFTFELLDNYIPFYDEWDEEF